MEETEGTQTIPEKRQGECGRQLPRERTTKYKDGTYTNKCKDAQT